MDYYHGDPLAATELTGHYVLTTIREQIPVGWARHELGRWWLGVLDLDVVDVVDGSGRRLGVCVGHPVSHRALEHGVLELRGHGGAPAVDIEDFYEHVTGRYITILIQQGRERLYLDPYGSVATAFKKDVPIAASNPHLVGETAWDNELIAALGMPESGLWYPAGLTPKEGVRRLLPNHYLDLDTWTAVRHWPSAASDLQVEPNSRRGVDIIVDAMERTLAVITARYPVQVTLTAGRDSRMENRLGCWAAPQHFGNGRSRFAFWPFNHRLVFAATMRLPYEFRRRQELPNAVCRTCWPELLDYPFNQFTGLRKYLARSRGITRRLRTATRRRIARWVR
jgi:hypothetical protein